MVLLKILLWLVLVPLLLGLLYTYFSKNNKNNIILAFVAGYIIELALFELIALPITFLKVKFSVFLVIWNISILVMALISSILNLKRIKEIITYNLEQIKKLPLLSVLVFILIGLQLFVVFRYMHIDDDDAFYVGTATTTIYTDQINMHNPNRGNEWGGWQARYVLSPFAIYLAVVSEETGMTPTAIAHTIFPVIFVSLMYMIYFLIGQRLFKEDKKAICLFLLLINILYIFGNYSVRTNFTFALFRIWQGKAFLANIILPAIWYWYLVSSEENMPLNEMIMMFVVMIAACLPTSMGVVLGPLTVGILALVSAIKNKKINYLWKYAITCVPCIICGIIFLILKG